MNCPYCGRQSYEGTASYMSIQGFAQIIISYEPVQKNELQRCPGGALVRAGEAVKACYCEHCKKIFCAYDCT